MHTFVVLAYKESPYLRECIESVLNQKYSSKVIIATSTPNNFIYEMAKSYNLEVFENPNPGQGIGYDFDFAISCADSDALVTIAHQDDVYEREYSEKVVNMYNSHPKATIIFSDYYEIREKEKVFNNANLKIKRILLTPLHFSFLAKKRFGKRLALRFGCPICCPAVTFVKKNISTGDIFKSDLKCDVDWFAWEKLTYEKGSFIFIKENLMGHRVHEDSTTTEIIKDDIRTKEDLIMFKKFWPVFIAKMINKFYIKSEKSNQN